jgi:hypothetical protein
VDIPTDLGGRGSALRPRAEIEHGLGDWGLRDWGIKRLGD